MMDDLRGGWWWEGKRGPQIPAHSCLDDGAVCLWKVGEGGLGKLRAVGLRSR